MKTIAFSSERVFEIPETWVEGEKMINTVIRQASGRGRNQEIMSVCARIAYGLCCNQKMTPDPTTALAFLMQRLCQKKGAGLER